MVAQEKKEGVQLETRPLPDPGRASIRRILGPGLLLAALGVGMGETFMWPRLVIVFGPDIRWIATVGLLIQIFVTMEIARWTYYTGESIFQAGYRLHPAVTWYFYVLAIMVYVWPGHVVTGSSALALFLGTDWMPIAILSIVSIALVLIISPYQVYKTVKTILLVSISLMMAVSLAVALFAGTPAMWGDALCGTVSFGWASPTMYTKAWLPLIIGAMAFIGPSGMQQMWYTLWAREEGVGMAAYMPKVTGLIFGKEQKWRDRGFAFDCDLGDEYDKWKRWRKLNILDAWVSLGVMTFITTLFFTILSMSAAEASPAAMSAIKAGETLAAIDAIATAFTSVSQVLYPLWFIVMFLVGWKMSFGIFDAFARAQADMTLQLLKVSRGLGIRKWYYVWVLTVTLVGIAATVIGSPKGPVFMLDVLAFLSPLAMGSYCLLLLHVNRKMMPPRLRMSWASTIALASGAVFYLGSLFYCLFAFGTIPSG